ASPVSAATTEAEQFGDFEELDLSLSDPMAASEAADDIELSEAATSEALSELFGESLEDAIASSETAGEADDLDTLLASATPDPDDFSGLFEASDDSATAPEDQLETETFGSEDIDLSDGAGEDENILDFDALMTTSSEPTEGMAEPSDTDFDALLGDNLDEFEASTETDDTSTSADLDDFLIMSADDADPGGATDLDDWLSDEGAKTFESEFQLEDRDASSAIAAEEAVEAGSFDSTLDFDGPSQESESLFSEGLGDIEISQDNIEISQDNTVSSDTDLLFDDITTEPLPDSDLTPDFTSEASPADFDDVFGDAASAETAPELDSDATPVAASDLDDLFNGASPTEPTLIPNTDAIPLADTDALDDLFGTPEEAGDAVAPATTEAPADLFDLAAPADEAPLADTDALDDLFGTPEEAGDAVAPATTEAPADLFDLAAPHESADSDPAGSELDPESTSDLASDSGLDDFLGDDFLAAAASENVTDFAEVDSDDFFAEDSQASPDDLIDEGTDTLAFDLGGEREESAGISADEVSLDDLLESSAETAEAPTSSVSSPEDITDFFDENPSSVDESIDQGADPLATDATSDSADVIDFNANDLGTEDLFGDSNGDDLATDLFGDAAQPEADAFADVSVADTNSVLDSSEATDLDAEDLFGTDDLDSEVADLFGDAAPLEVEAIAATPDVETDEPEAPDSDATDLFGDSDLAVEATDLFSEASESDTDDGNTDALLDVDGLGAPNVPDLESGSLFGEDDLDSEIDDLFNDSLLEPVNDAAAASSTDVDSLELEGFADRELEANTLLGDLNLDDASPSPLDEALPEESVANSDITPDTPSNDFEDLNALLGDESAGPTMATETFSDLDALLSDEPGEPSSIADFDELDALLEDDPTDSPASSASEADDFGELDALLGEDIAPSVTGTALADADAENEFSDLEKLLEEADQTLGGSSPTIRATTGSRVSRRVSAMVDKTMRVSVKHLDILNNLVGELVVNRNSLEQDQERLRQFLDNLLFQVQQLNDVGQRMRDLYERSLLESSLMSSRQSFHGTGVARVSEGHGSGNGGTTGHATGATFDALEMDRFTGFHTLSQEMIELIVRVRESASDIGYTVESSDQITRQFRQVTTQLQEGLNKARMVPFAQTADRLPRAVRDISLKCGKEARLVVEGRDTLIDKMILERLYDPMTHLVNNAITHGIETPEERIALGKPREGIITVRAFYQGNQTVIYIADDGAGIDPDFVKRKAISKGILTTADANEMSVLDTYELLFRPGFSTRDQADAFAGRGVGMDVVRTALSEIRGSITIDSEQGKGTSFTIRLPLTLSISKALSCLNNQARIAFPMDGVEDMFDVPKERIRVDENEQSSIQWRDTRLTFQPLSELLQFNRSLGRGRVYGGNQDEDAVSIVVLRSANTFIGLQVDRVLGEQEIVIKQLEGPVPKPMGIAGATVLGDGRVMPIADVLELIDIAQGRVRREAGSSLWTQADEPPLEELVETKSEPTVLIVDDSITVRELLSMSFNKVGYRVEQARDGQEAWEKLRSGLPCDLVFCDIEMPRMDGLELLSRLQKDTGLKRIPIAMLTSRGADRHRQMALDLGANGYFTKPYLEEALLDAAQRMLNGEVLLKAAE
ncbi:MAG: response regulator, partial [Cyanobacteria bacterium J06559_3]